MTHRPIYSLIAIVLIIPMLLTPTSMVPSSIDVCGMDLHPNTAIAEIQPSPYKPNQWFEMWSNISSGRGEYLLYKITSETNDTWWSVEVWNQTSQTLNQTSYVKKLPGENGHRSVFSVVDYAVANMGQLSHPYQWDRWFDLEGVGMGSQIGPIDSEEGDSVNLTVASTEFLTTPAGTFECWKANESTVSADVNYWIDKSSNVTVQMTYYIPSFSITLMEQLSNASWLVPPEISAVQSDPLRFSATVTWTTNEASNSSVNYGTNISDLNMTAISTELVTQHSVLLLNLAPLTTYYYEVTSSDEWGNTATDNNTGTYYSFITLSASAPEITSLNADPLSNTSARITFDTNVQTNVTIWYGPSEPLLDSIIDPVFATHHEVEIGGLEEWTEYLYIVGVIDGSGNAANSTVRSFITLDQTPPCVISYTVTIVEGTLNISIESQEPFRCELYIGNTTNSLTLAQNQTQFNSNQTMIATGLPSFTIIHYELVLIDQSGNPFTLLNETKPFSVLVPDYLEPVLSHPDDVFLTEGQTPPSITWIVFDQTPLTYEVVVDGTSMGMVSWNGASVTVSIEDLTLTLGVHTIELALRDVFGNMASDIVVVTISPARTAGTAEILQNMAVVGLGIFSLVIVLLVIRRRR